MPHRYLVKYTKEKFQDSIQIGTLWYYRDLVGNHSDYQDGLLAFRDGKVVVPSKGVDYQSYFDIANCYVLCLTVQDDLSVNEELADRFGGDFVLPCGLIGDEKEPTTAYPVMHGKDGEIPFYAVPSNDPQIDRSGEVYVQIKTPLTDLFSQEIYVHMERSNRIPVRDSHKENRFEIRYWANFVTYLDAESQIALPDGNPEHLANAIVYAKESSFSVEKEYRIAFRLFDKLLNRFVSVNYDPIVIPIEDIHHPSAKFYV